MRNVSEPGQLMLLPGANARTARRSQRASSKGTVEDAFRRHGIEGEDAFCALAAFCVRYYDAKTGPASEYIREQGNRVLDQVLSDASLRGLLEHTAARDPEGRQLAVWYQHFLGRRFRLETGKFFTPRSIADAMAALLPVGEGSVIFDPTCGGGTFLAAASEAHRDYGCRLIGNDVDRMLVALTDLVLAVSAPANHERQLFCCNVYDEGCGLESLHGTIDGILANPPFSLTLHSVAFESKLFRLGYRNSDALFLDRALRLLRPGGRLVCLLPHTIIANSEYARLRQAVEQDWDLLGVIGLPEGVFHLTAGTQTRADIVMLRKRAPSLVATADAVFCHVPSVGIPLNSRDATFTGNALWEIVTNPKVRAALELQARGDVP